MIIQGAQDPHVPQTESDLIVNALRDRGIEVRYDSYPAEGHGFTNYDNEIRALSDAAGFLAGASTVTPAKTRPGSPSRQYFKHAGRSWLFRKIHIY